jgi:hypothetical protein
MYAPGNSSVVGQRKNISGIASCFLATAIIGCSSGGNSGDSSEGADAAGTAALRDIPNSHFYASANNSALLSGPVIGSGSIDNTAIRKTVPFSVKFPDADLEVKEVYILSESDFNQIIVGVLHNVSESVVCNIEVGMIEFLGADGSALANQSLFGPFFDGSIGQLQDGSDYYSPWCLVPDEMAYFNDSVDTEEEIASLVIDSITSSDSIFTSVDTVVTTLSYSIDQDQIAVTIVNQSSLSIALGYVNILALDENGLPLGYDFIYAEEQVLGPGAETVITQDFYLQGNSTNLRVILDFELAE